MSLIRVISEKPGILTKILSLNNVQHVQFVPHVQYLGTLWHGFLGTQEVFGHRRAATGGLGWGTLDEEDKARSL